jgi:SWI/SNF-related matrix-associated actin-dependent regulator of chromatin subfamily D
MEVKTSKRRRKTETTAESSDGLNDICISFPESSLFKKLVEIERGIERIHSQTKVNCRDTFSGSLRLQRRVLRISISHTTANQGAFYHIDPFDNHSLSHPPAWTLLFHGTVMERTTSDLLVGTKDQQKFSKYFKKILIEIRDSSENNFLEWNPQTNPGVDGFEIRRVGNQDAYIHFFLFLEYSPPRFKLSEKLKRFLKVDLETCSRTLMSIYTYIKHHSLQSTTNRQLIQCDEVLKQLFNVPEFDFNQLLQLLTPHFLPPDPIEIIYPLNLRVGSGSESYDLETDFDICNDDLYSISMDELEKEIQNHQDEIYSNLELLHKHRTERQYLLKFIRDPINELNFQISEQIRESKVLI